MSKESAKPVSVLMKVRLVRHDGSNWYGDAEIGNEYEIVKVNERTYTIKMDDKFSVGLDKDHCEIISPLPQKILTEEELSKIAKDYAYDDGIFMKVIYSHLELFKSNAELSFKNQKYKEFLNDQRIEDYELGNMKQLDRLNRFLEELK